jgi:hypothetical protein
MERIIIAVAMSPVNFQLFIKLATEITRYAEIQAI